MDIISGHNLCKEIAMNRNHSSTCRKLRPIFAAGALMTLQMGAMPSTSFAGPTTKESMSAYDWALIQGAKFWLNTMVHNTGDMLYCLDLAAGRLDKKPRSKAGLQSLADGNLFNADVTAEAMRAFKPYMDDDKLTGNEFLLAIAGIGNRKESSIDERYVQQARTILANHKIDDLHGTLAWGLARSADWLLREKSNPTASVSKAGPSP